MEFLKFLLQDPEKSVEYDQGSSVCYVCKIFLTHLSQVQGVEKGCIGN